MMEWLNAREVKNIKNQIKAQWGDSPDFKDYFFLKRRDDRVAMVSRSIEELNVEHINTAGLYILRMVSKEPKLTIEGSQLVGPKATKNMVELTEEELQQWIRGFDIQKEGFAKGFQIIKHKNDYAGCAKHLNGELHNMVPKERRIKSLQ